MRGALWDGVIRVASLRGGYLDRDVNGVRCEVLGQLSLVPPITLELFLGLLQLNSSSEQEPRGGSSVSRAAAQE